jgi:hypothetical protein
VLPRCGQRAPAEKLDQENSGKPANSDDQRSANEFDRAKAVRACSDALMRNGTFRQALSLPSVPRNVSPAEMPRLRAKGVARYF